MGTLLTQSTLDLQFVLAQTPEFDHYFDTWQDAYETFERLIGLLGRTEFGEELISLTTIRVLRETRLAARRSPMHPSSRKDL
jgi:hypothetical protein